MVRDLGMLVGDICRWLYVLGCCSVLTSRLWEGRCEEIGLERCRRDGRLAEGVPAVGAGTAVIGMIGCRMGCALRTAGFVCIYSLFIFMRSVSFHVMFFRKDVPKSGDSRSVTDTSPWTIRLPGPSPISSTVALYDTGGASRAARAEGQHSPFSSATRTVLSLLDYPSLLSVQH
jgi:hypothetical protein